MSEPSTPPRPAAPPSDWPPIVRLVEIMRILRSPQGCPWDHKQTLQTLKEHLVEESHEVLDAIDSGDRSKLCDELGDLLLQVVFQAQLCREEGAFTFDDVANSIAQKLVRRHPHVFGDVQVSGSDEVLKNWEAIKKQEKANQTRGTLEGIPKSLPALHKANLVQKRVARVGFDWDNVEGALAKLEEEVAEIREAVASGNQDHVREELGDLLFATVNVSRFFGQNAEVLLEQTIRKFSRRFDALESIVHAQGRNVSDCTLAELDVVWEQVKAGEKQ
jgi:tetrapyrrole methylase family protein/MazG family protein